ncbi:Wax ester/triacylglycerol synthase family O-acyltransferase [Rubrivivax sp. A210]|uniref:wax ester/triacylglycerol synthase family O-acyltransferase n=1 Tax=Rubrivivax sp. A210 TaxID=2772301 RepID=UPI00191939D9|nr:wax ester/triacylglycerol synthase family O-acyltransferase [Rubrivivax sp. A210]CAD5366380.1 Wax ester/triacylglycerol synthase family O-acyltransferase [Rubrivivax sp. A210]
MKQLSGLDATFLYLETAAMPMHVGALHVFELPAGFKGRWLPALRKHIAERLPLAPVLRRRLWWMPLNMANPAWVDAEPDLKAHIVEIKLPKGAGMAELEAQVGALHPVLLDRSRPLWKMHVFEGLAPGANGLKRVGLYTQLHHAAVDGQAAVALANVLLDVRPEGREIEVQASRRTRTFRLEMTEMLRGVLGSQAQKVADIVRNLPATVGTIKDAASSAVSHSALITGRKGSGNVTLAPRTALNMSVTPGRAYATVTLPLAELKALGRAFDATVNDMVLAVCSGALRRYFMKRRALPRKSLVAAVPISLREKGDTAPDNQASLSLVSLGTHIADPLARLQHVQAATAAMKSTMGSLKSILPTDFPSLGVPWLMEAAAALYGKARVADRIPQVANVVISNVPGPPVPLYMAGAHMLTNYPTSIVVHGMGLNITVQSYDGSLDFGLMADAQAMPDVRELADAINVAWDDLCALNAPAEAEAPLAGAVGRAARRIGGGLVDAVGSAVGGAVGKVARSVAKTVVQTAVDAAVTQVTRQPRANTPARRRRAG